MKWKNPLLILCGIGISNVGAWVYLIALNLIILDMTRSPFSVSILYMLLPIATLFTNLWSGSLIDRFNISRNDTIVPEDAKHYHNPILFNSKLNL